ncbi:MAG: hypothetical protein HYR91_03740 [Flavobacteriia bacterium]|nr:hypothetical protein [Flavobacteriia bacterium]
MDAQGNQLSVYEHEVNNSDVLFSLKENHIFGSSRLGMLNQNVNMYSNNNPTNVSSVLGNKSYELSNHLGNVNAVISDIKVPQTANTVTVSSYTVNILNISDYSGFGVPLDGRTVANSEFRYGYQSSECDPEIKGEGNSYTTEFRMLDPRIGRWLSLDPLMSKYPWQSPYVSMDNSPIRISDHKGLNGEDEVAPAGHKEAKSIDGSTIYIPSEAKTAVLNGEQKVKLPQGTVVTMENQTLVKFQIGEDLYQAGYINDKFFGYINYKSGDIYKSPEGICNDGTVSESSWGETQGVYPTKNMDPSEAEKYDPAKWDADKTDLLLKARASINYIAENRNSDVQLDNPNAKSNIEQTLSTFHMTCNFPTVPTEITSDPSVTAFFLGTTKTDRHTGLNYNTHDVKIVAAYGPFYNTGGGDVVEGAMYILFYSVKPKK